LVIEEETMTPMMLAPVLSQYGFPAAAKAARDGNVTMNGYMIRAWGEYNRSGGNNFVNLESGRVYEAPKVLLKKRGLA
jgi:hypothetical protein